MTEDDPYEGLDDADDREGDPFEHIGSPAEDEADDGSDGFGVFGPPGEDDRDDAAETGRAGDSAPAGGPAADPFADVDTPDGSPFDGAGNQFERVDVGGVDPDNVWEMLTDDGEDGTAETEAVPDESRYVEVSKHRFCEQCEHFTDPPDARCTEGTAEIIEFLDMETVRLLDCPVVAEQQALERDA